MNAAESPLINGGRCMYSTGGSEGAVKRAGMKNICYAAIDKWWTVAYVCIQLEGVKVQSSGRD
jgi:hypothetical protein